MGTRKECKELLELYRKTKDVRMEIAEKEKEKEGLEEQVKELEQEEQKKVTVKEKQENVMVKERAEKNDAEKFVEEIEKVMGCFVRLLSDDSFELLIKRREESKARIIINMISNQYVSIHVVLHPSITKSLRKRLETRLPIQSDRIVDVKEMKEMVCRYYWILCHTC